MLRSSRRIAVTGSALAVAVLTTLGAAVPAGADPVTDGGYGMHVMDHHGPCDGVHDPGMEHPGTSGWHEHMHRHHG